MLFIFESKVRKGNKMKFTELALNEDILKALQNGGFTNPTEVQQKTLAPVLQGNDVVVRSQTGSGKTFAFALPLLQNMEKELNTVQALIVCPTRELALQVSNEIAKLAKFLQGIKIVSVYGGSDISRQIRSLKQKPQIVVGTPGRIMDHMRRHTLKLQNLKTIVLDEADEMLNMGFKEDIETILQDIPKQHQTLMFSATFPAFIKKITKEFMTNPISIEVGEQNKSLSNIKQTYATVKQKDKKEALLDFFETIQPKHPIVFTNTKAMADSLQKTLSKEGYDAHALHGEMRQSARRRVMLEMKRNPNSILVASDVAARGIDIDDVDYVINFDLPNNVEYFLHRIGRTGRAGKKGNAFTLLASKQQLKQFKDYEKQTHSNTQELVLEVSSSFASTGARIRAVNPSVRFGANKPRSTRAKQSGENNRKNTGRNRDNNVSQFAKRKNNKNSKYAKSKSAFSDVNPSNERKKGQGNTGFNKEDMQFENFSKKLTRKKTKAFSKFEKPTSRKNSRKNSNTFGTPSGQGKSNGFQNKNTRKSENKSYAKTTSPKSYGTKRKKQNYKSK